MPEHHQQLELSGLLADSSLAVELYRLAVQNRSGGVLILRGPTAKRPTTEASFCSERWGSVVRELLG